MKYLKTYENHTNFVPFGEIFGGNKIMVCIKSTDRINEGEYYIMGDMSVFTSKDGKSREVREILLLRFGENYVITPTHYNMDSGIIKKHFKPYDNIISNIKNNPKIYSNIKPYLNENQIKRLEYLDDAKNLGLM